MISPLQFNNISNVNFKGNDSKNQNAYQKTSSRLTQDVYQSAAPKKQKGIVDIIKAKVADPIQRAMAEVNAQKAQEMSDIYGVVQDYQAERKSLRKQVVEDFQEFNHTGAVFDSSFAKGINSAPKDGSTRSAISRNSYFEYQKTDVQSKYMPNSDVCQLLIPTDLVMEEKNTPEYSSSSRYMDLENMESFTNLKYYKPEANCDTEFEADVAVALDPKHKKGVMGDLARHLGGPFIANGLEKKAGKNIYFADKLTVFDTNKDGLIEGARTYENVRIIDTLHDKSTPVEERQYEIKADTALFTDLTGDKVKDISYHQDYSKFTGIVDSPEMRPDCFKTIYTTTEDSEALVKPSNNGTVKAYLAYSNSDLDGVLYATKKTIEV